MYNPLQNKCYLKVLGLASEFFPTRIQVLYCGYWTQVWSDTTGQTPGAVLWPITGTHRDTSRITWQGRSGENKEAGQNESLTTMVDDFSVGINGCYKNLNASLKVMINNYQLIYLYSVKLLHRHTFKGKREDLE